MSKVINIKAQEDITSVIERLWETGEEEVFLVVPNSSELIKNIIALKLLKREADRLGKQVLLITKDAVGREMAKRAGLASKIALPKKAQEEENETLHDVPPDKFESLIEDEVRIRRENSGRLRRLSDIRPKPAIMERHSIEFEQSDEKVTLPAGGEERESDGEPNLNDFIQGDIRKKALADDFFKIKKVENSDDFEEDRGAEGEPEQDRAEKIPLEYFDNEEDDDDGQESFPIQGLAGGARRILVKEKKSFFDRFLSVNLNRIKGAFRFQESSSRRHKRSLILPLFSGKFLGLFLGASFLVLLASLYFILPKAEVAVVPKAQAVSQNLNILADKGTNQADFVKNNIPAQLIKLDMTKSREFDATGQRQVNEKAKGVITIYNEYSSSPQVLVATTRFVAENGKVFRLIKAITVPGAKIEEGKIAASSIEAEVAADQPGPDYNIQPGRFTIPGFQGTPKYAAFYGQSNSAMSGGASGIMKVVTQDDYNRAKDNIWQELQPALDGEFKKQLPKGLKMLDGALKEEISGMESSVGAGSPAEKFTMSLKGTATAVMFDEGDVLQAIENKLADKLNTDKELSVSPDQISYELSSIDFAKGQAGMKIAMAGNIVWKIDSEALKKEIAGRDEEAIRDVIAAHSEIEEARVVFRPFWMKKAPNNLDKVIITVIRE